jgi:tetratricopeptide (TPR) repeat protein
LPFPFWIKASFVGLLALAASSVIYNYPFADALFTAWRAARAWEAKETDDAIQLMDRALRIVPDCPTFRRESAVYHAVQLVHQGRPREAASMLVEMDRLLPGSQVVHEYAVQAEMHTAYQDKRYDVMLEKALEVQKLIPNSVIVSRNLAWAYACRYAETGDPVLKEKALQTLAAAAELHVTEPGASGATLQRFQRRIRYILDTRAIIEPKEFDKRFPPEGKGEAKVE